MSYIDDSTRRGLYSRAVVAAAERLRNDVDHSRIPWSEHILLVSAGEDDDVEPTEIMVKVRAAYLQAVQGHFDRNPLPLDSMTDPTIAPGVADTSAAPFGPADLVIFSESPESIFVPPDLDPATMIGRDVDDAGRELTSAGWLVRRIADGDAITADYSPGRANLHFRGNDTPEGRTVYATSIG